MSKKSKSTKQVRAIDRIIKFQIDDGIESLTISGKEVLADVAIDRKANVTLFLNADPDKINEIKSLVPFVTVQTVRGGTETDKTKTVTLSQDLTQFALEIAENSKELASLIKTQSSITLDLAGLVQKLLEIADKLAELEQKNQEQDQRLTDIEAKDQEQDQRLTATEAKDLEQDNHLTALAEKDIEQDNRLSFLENNGNTANLKTIKSTNYQVESVSLNISENFASTYNMVGDIGRGVRNAICFITISRSINGEYDGNATFVGAIFDGKVSFDGLLQEHILEMKSISEESIKIRCELVDYGEIQLKLLDIPKSPIATYNATIHYFRFDDELVLAPQNDIIFG